MSEDADNVSSEDADLAFEDAVNRLEELVREMESEEMPLEKLIEHFEQGTQLYRICEKRLDEARGRIEIIRKKRNRETVAEPFGGGAESIEEESSAEPEASREHGELF